MVEWTTARLAGLIIAIIVLVIIIFFLYAQLGSESGTVTTLSDMWGEYFPSS